MSFVEVLYRQVLYVMSIVYYFGDQNCRIPQATAKVSYKILALVFIK